MSEVQPPADGSRPTSPLAGLFIATTCLAAVLAALFALHPEHSPRTLHVCIAITVYILMTLHLWTQNSGESLMIVVLTIGLGLLAIPSMSPGLVGSKQCVIVATVLSALVAARSLRRYVSGEPWID